jgi:hypothetical protein
MSRGWMLGCLAAFACAAPNDEAGGSEGGHATHPTPPELTTSPTTPTGGTTGSTGPTTTTSVSTSDCTRLPSDGRVLDHMPSSEEFALSADGYLVNVSDVFDAAVRTPYDGASEMIGPFESWEVAAVRLLPDGDLVIADEANGQVVRMGPDGGQLVVIAGLVSPNSMTVDADGMLFVTAYDELLKVDPDTGESAVLFKLPGRDLDGLTFSPDYETLYFNHDDGGIVGWVKPNGWEPVEPTTLAALGADFWASLDGMAVDRCGGLYVLATNGELLRIRVDGTTELVADLAVFGGVNTTAVQFGSGFGGFEADNLYVMNRTGGVVELELGIEGKWEPHLPHRDGE